AQIGGDFYDIIRLNDSTYGFLIADVTGHGIPAALLTFMSSTVFKNSAVGVYSTCEVIGETNKRIVGKMPAGMFATMFYMIYDQLSRKLLFTQAGHPPALLIRPSTDQIMPLRTEGSLVGIFDDGFIEYGQGSIILQSGDLVILYTDAILESIGRTFLGKELDQLIALIRQRLGESIETLLEDIYCYGLSCNSSAKYEDDVTLLGFKVHK
ncbi:serine/threonine-protein phosphatase, partial [candidate division KSB1 bacterium]|nr:serine/threonine-protein phosphatase [candidate division KSB1 bacterium]